MGSTTKDAPKEGGQDHEIKCCICHRIEDPKSNSMLVSPCCCVRPQSFLHRSCLEGWVMQNGALTCPMCKVEFKSVKGENLSPTEAFVVDLGEYKKIPVFKLFTAQLLATWSFVILAIVLASIWIDPHRPDLLVSSIFFSIAIPVMYFFCCSLEMKGERMVYRSVRQGFTLTLFSLYTKTMAVGWLEWMSYDANNIPDVSSMWSPVDLWNLFMQYFMTTEIFALVCLRVVAISIFHLWTIFLYCLPLIVWHHVLIFRLSGVILFLDNRGTVQKYFLKED